MQSKGQSKGHTTPAVPTPGCYTLSWPHTTLARTTALPLHKPASPASCPTTKLNRLSQDSSSSGAYTQHSALSCVLSI